jgi:predicted nucleic acid-binding protein
MIIIDASAMVEALVGSQVDDELLDALQVDLHAPHLLDVEVVAVLRGLTLIGKLKPGQPSRRRPTTSRSPSLVMSSSGWWTEPGGSGALSHERSP